jgi:dephospho-CoA kinase
LSTLQIGLTGGLAAGKSTVAGWLREAGLTVIDADHVVADLYRPGQAGARAVAELFGPEVLDASGAVDRTRLAEWVFTDGAARRRLEAAIHPLVRQRFLELADSTEGMIALEATLLVEADYADAFDVVVTVEADRETRLARSIARGLSPEQAAARLAAQGDGASRRAAADVELCNEGSPEELRRQVDELVTSWRKRTSSRGAGAR